MDLRREAVVGTSCSGKTMFAAALAARLEAAHIELDALHWRPGWSEVPLEEFRAATSKAVAAERWVCDGNYGKVRDLVWGRATTVVWLNYPFTTVAWRALRRTFRRALLREELYGGNRETLTQAFCSRDSILLWVVTTHGQRHKEYPQLFAQPDYARLSVVEFTRPAQAARFLQKQVVKSAR